MNFVFVFCLITITAKIIAIYVINMLKSNKFFECKNGKSEEAKSKT